MKSLTNFVLPFSGLKNGIYLFDYQIDKNFFEKFENAIIKEGNLGVQLKFDKRPSFFVLTFNFSGTIDMICDRCLENFDMPMQGEQQLIVRLDEADKEEEEEIVYIKPTDVELDVSKYIYELIHLGLPIRKICVEDENGNPTCNTTVMQYLTGDESSEVEEEEEPKTSGNLWSALKDLKID